MKAAIGCVASLAYFGFIGLLIAGNILGDCFPDTEHICPTDHERNVTILSVFFGGLLLWGLTAYAFVRVGRHLNKEDD